LKNSELLKLIIKELGWKAEMQIKSIDNGDFGHEAMSVTYKSKNHEVQSFGQGATKDEAVFKAVMELLERLSFFKHKSSLFFQEKMLGRTEKTKVELGSMYPGAENWLLNTSSGFAIHTDKKLAMESALNELIERHVILKALLRKVSPKKEAAESIDGIETNYYSWKGPVGRFVSVYRGVRSQKTIYGFGAAKSLKESKEKAFLEAVPRLGLLLKENIEDKVVLSTNENFLYHFYEQPKETTAFFEGATEDKLPELSTSTLKTDIWFAEVEVPLSEVLKKNFYAVRAVSPVMQAHFTGKWDKKFMNPLAMGIYESFPEDLHIVG